MNNKEEIIKGAVELFNESREEREMQINKRLEDFDGDEMCRIDLVTGSRGKNRPVLVTSNGFQNNNIPTSIEFRKPIQGCLSIKEELKITELLLAEIRKVTKNDTHFDSYIVKNIKKILYAKGKEIELIFGENFFGIKPLS